jgi:hypothetical protein
LQVSTKVPYKIYANKTFMVNLPQFGRSRS